MEQVVIFIFGAIVGSFLNVVILRYNTGQSLVKGGSRCFNCGHKLDWLELIPIFSFLFQAGRCRQCRSKISWQYPIVEILTGIIFVLVFSIQLSAFNNFSFYFLLSTVYYLVIFSLLIIIAVYDFRHQIIPDLFVYTFIILSFLSLFQVSNFKFQISSFLAGVAFFVFFAAIWFLTKGKGMGFGDAKLALGLGWFLGLEKGIWALMISFWLGAGVGIFLVFLFKKRYNIKSKIAFGPFMILGLILSFFINNFLFNLI